MSTGVQGFQGPVGPRGLTGPIGIQGPTGAQGPVGIQGIQGIAGPSPVGPTGPTGVLGILNNATGSVLTTNGSDSSVSGQPNLLFDGTGLNANVNVVSPVGNLRVSNGTAGNPAYSFINDITSGMYSPASNSLAFSVAGTEDIRILSNGNVGIGLTNPGFQLELSTDSAAKPTSSAWTISSDERIKRNIVDADIQTCYDTVKTLKLKRFEWDPSWNATLPDRHSLGFIAQEVKQFFPKSIHSIERNGLTDFHTLDVDQVYMSMYGTLVKVIQDIDALETELAQLKQQVY